MWMGWSEAEVRKPLASKAKNKDSELGRGQSDKVTAGPTWHTDTGTHDGTRAQTQREGQQQGGGQEHRGWAGQGEVCPAGHL